MHASDGDVGDRGDLASRHPELGCAEDRAVALGDRVVELAVKACDFPARAAQLLLHGGLAGLAQITSAHGRVIPSAERVCAWAASCVKVEEVSTPDVITLLLAVGSFAVSAWAATTAHRARQWQHARDAERRQTRVRITFAHSVGERQWYVLGDEAPPQAYSITTKITNHGETTEWVVAVALEEAEPPGEADGARMVLSVFGDEAHEGHDEPYELPPRKTQMISKQLSPSALGWMKAGGFRAVVWLGSSQRVESDPQQLYPDLVARAGT